MNSQLMEAIQQKVELSQQLDQWQQDMQELLEEQMNRKMVSHPFFPPHNDPTCLQKQQKQGKMQGGGGGGDSDSSQSQGGERKRSKLFSFLKLPGST